jgi:N-methylhydantoinase A
VLGYISPEATFGSERGGFRPDRELAERAIRERIAEPLGLSLTDAALGIVEVANAKMANALENEIIGRGFDPRDFVLMSYGGAGPFHAVGYAQSLGINSIVVPGEAASVWSAFGISQADIRYQYEASVVMLEPFSATRIEDAFGALALAARAALTEREEVSRFEFRRYARMRFQWQLHELEMRLPDAPITDERVEQISREFVAMYAERYGEAALLPGARLEIGSLRLEPAAPMGSQTLDRLTLDERPFHQGTRPLYFERGAGPVEGDIYNCDAMPVGETVEGPAIIDLAITGIVLPPGSSCERRKTGDFVLNLNLA